MKHPSLNSPIFSHKVAEKLPFVTYVPIRKVHVCMCVCVQLPRTSHLLHFSVKNVSKRLTKYPVVEQYLPLWLLLFNRKVACHSQGEEIQPGREAFCSKTYSASSYSWLWRDRAATVCWAILWTDVPSRPKIAIFFQAAKHSIVWGWVLLNSHQVLTLRLRRTRSIGYRHTIH